MRIFAAGATGVLGRRVLPRLVAAGHEVTATVRSPAKAEWVRSTGAASVRVDLFDPDAVRHAVDGHQVVLNLTTHIPPPAKAPHAKAWRENDRIRSQVSRHLVDAALAARAKRVVQESVTLVYPDRGSGWLDEDVALEPPGFAAAVPEAETNAHRFPAGAVVLRFGMFYGPDSVHTQAQIRMARAGFSPFPGDRSGYLSFLHVDDAAAAVQQALVAPPGTYNVVDRPLARRALDSVLAASVGRQRLVPFPRAFAALAGAPLRLMSRSHRVSNRRWRDATGWAPGHGDAREAWREVVAASGRQSRPADA